MRRLRKRAQFLRAAQGRRASGHGLTLQTVASEHDLPGVGFTVTKRAGNAVVRNRIKRRLRSVVSACVEDFSLRHDYVLIGRRDVLHARFEDLAANLQRLLAKVNTNSQSPRRT